MENFSFRLSDDILLCNSYQDVACFVSSTPHMTYMNYPHWEIKKNLIYIVCNLLYSDEE